MANWNISQFRADSTFENQYNSHEQTKEKS